MEICAQDISYLNVKGLGGKKLVLEPMELLILLLKSRDKILAVVASYPQLV